jgi:hypothetical protein
MLLSLRGLKDSHVRATDGIIGKVEQFLFDDEKWTVRYLLVNTGGWLNGRKVLISPISVVGRESLKDTIEVSLSRHEVEQSPDIDTDKPVSRQMEAHYHDYYGYPYYWGSAGVWGFAGYPSQMIGRLAAVPSAYSVPESDKGDPHLRSTEAVHGYRIDATDHHFGQLEDFVIDNESWEIRYLVIDTVKFWPSKSVLIAPHWVDSISWTDRNFKIGLTEEQIKKSPEYNSEEPVNRQYEKRLYDYYGRPSYWEKEEAPHLSRPARQAGHFNL